MAKKAVFRFRVTGRGRRACIHDVYRRKREKDKIQEGKTEMGRVDDACEILVRGRFGLSWDDWHVVESRRRCGVGSVEWLSVDLEDAVSLAVWQGGLGCAGMEV